MESNWGSSDDLFTQTLLELASRFEGAAEKVSEKPSDWIQKNFIIPSPRDPITGQILPTGPIVLAPHQIRVIDEALSKDEYGKYKYATVIYSAPKKSGKSATAAAIALYMAAHTPYGYFALLANDGKQSGDRLLEPIRKCLMFHKQRGLSLSDTRINLVEVFLPNAAHIEAVPVDASGEAGSEPSGVFFSELWGFTSDAKKKIFAEMTLPPTLWGRSLRFIETYAGYTGISDLLWELYKTATNGEPHPDFLDLEGKDGESVVWTNKEAMMFAYWDTVARLPWQVDEYYKQEAQILSPPEFQRLHRNQWVSPIDTYIEGVWWDACQDTSLPKLLPGSTVPCVIAIDAAISGDCAAIALVTRDPRRPDTDVAVRYCKIFKPTPGHPIKIEDYIGYTIRMLSMQYNIVCCAYDAYQMEGLIQNYRQGNVNLTEQEKADKSREEVEVYLHQQERAAQLWYFKFGQQAPRAVADKRLYDMILNRQVHWNPNDIDSDIAARGNDETLTKHIKQAGKKNTGNQMRIEKLANDAKIDAAVTLSMATDRCMTMLLDNREMHVEDLLRSYQSGKISYQDYMNAIQQRKVDAVVGNDS